jgi:Ca2+:H+ antiporter
MLSATFALAVSLGEPLGTLILTLSVVTIEVMMISAVMLTGSSQPTLARDTMFAVVMIVMNGLIGISLLIGGWRHHEQRFNLSGANAYLAVTIPLAALGLVLPSLTQSTATSSLTSAQGVFFIVLFLALYGVFLAIQTVRHQDLFKPPVPEPDIVAAEVPMRRTPAPTATGFDDFTDMYDPGDDEDSDDPHANVLVRPAWIHVILLIAYMAPVVLLAKQLAYPINAGIAEFGAPVALGGFLVALLILSPEALSGLQAAAANKLQRAVNLYLGSVAATIGLTIPAVLIVSLVTGQEVILGLNPAETLLLAVTLILALLTFESRRTNVLHGAVHVVLFLAYLMLIFD